MAGLAHLFVRRQRQSGFDERRRDDATYRARYLDSLYEQAAHAQAELTAMAATVAGDVGEPGSRTEPKNRQRAEDKIAKYGNDASLLTDLAGARITYDRLDDLYRGLQQVINHPGVTIVNIDDRFTNPAITGYRDIQLSVRTSNGHIGEFRLHLRAIDEVAHWEHALYEVSRDIRALGEGRHMTLAEEAIRHGLRQRVRALFWEALQPALREDQP